MKKIILKKDEKRFSYIKYFLFRWCRIYSVYNENFFDDIFFIPLKKTVKKGYLSALCEFLKKRNITHILPLDEDVLEYMKSYFNVIIGKNIYSANFNIVLSFLSGGRLYDYEVVFVSDNLKIIKEEMEKCVKNAGSVSVLTQKPYLYESMKDYMLSKYGVTINIRTKKEKLKKHNKIYVNSGANRTFDAGAFKNVVMIDIFRVYEGALHHIIIEPDAEAKEYVKRLNCPYTAALAEFLDTGKKDKKYKIVNIKK